MEMHTWVHPHKATQLAVQTIEISKVQSHQLWKSVLTNSSEKHCHRLIVTTASLWVSHWAVVWLRVKLWRRGDAMTLGKSSLLQSFFELWNNLETLPSNLATSKFRFLLHLTTYSICLSVGQIPNLIVIRVDPPSSPEGGSNESEAVWKLPKTPEEEHLPFGRLVIAITV